MVECVASSSTQRKRLKRLRDELLELEEASRGEERSYEAQQGSQAPDLAEWHGPDVYQSVHDVDPRHLRDIERALHSSLRAPFA